MKRVIRTSKIWIYLTKKFIPMQARDTEERKPWIVILSQKKMKRWNMKKKRLMPMILPQNKKFKLKKITIIRN